MSKKRFINIIIMIIILNSIIRLVNIYYLAFGDVSQKESYALNCSSCFIWKTVDEYENFSILKKNKMSIEFKGDYQISDSNDSFWDILGIFGISNFNNKIYGLNFSTSTYECHIDLSENNGSFYCTDYTCEENKSSFYHTDYTCEENYYWFDIKNNSIIPNKEHKTAFQEHLNLTEEITTKTLYIIDDYPKVIKEFSVKALICEIFLLLINVCIVYIMSKKIKDNTTSEKENLKYEFAESLLYTFLTGTSLAVLICDNGSISSFCLLNIFIFIPVYIIATIIFGTIYFKKKFNADAKKV